MLFSIALAGLVQIAVSDNRLSICIDSLFAVRKLGQIDVEKCIGMETDEIEFKAETTGEKIPSNRSFNFKAFNSGKMIYQENIIDSKLALNISKTDSRFLKLSDYRLVIIGKKSGIPTTIMVFKNKTQNPKTKDEVYIDFGHPKNGWFQGISFEFDNPRTVDSVLSFNADGVIVNKAISNEQNHFAGPIYIYNGKYKSGTKYLLQFFTKEGIVSKSEIALERQE